MTISKKEAISLDKYYTKVEIAERCYKTFLAYFDNPSQVVFVEPSAGNGSFLKAIQDNVTYGFDILPEADNIAQLDFLKDELPIVINEYTVAIGNPPFGKRASLAIQFVNKCLDLFGIVGFIVPLQFDKWSVQKNIRPYARLIHNEPLPEESFTLVGKEYSIRCAFQIWSIKHTEHADMRIRSKPQTNHPDFEMWQFNRTVEAEKFFDYEWDFAVPRQGFQDYSFKALKQEECDRKKQWIFFKARNEEVLQNLLNLDFEGLSKRNSGIPGFGKADVIEAYEEVYGK